MSAGTEKRQFGFGYGHKVMMDVRIYKKGFISKTSSQIFHYDKPDRLH